MPNHWESSARPLFVKTVFINGSRHAILSQEDPLLQSASSSVKKQSRPNSSFTITRSFSLGGQDFIAENKRKFSESDFSRQRLTNDLTTDLQNCLINLRLVPCHQDNEKPLKLEKASCEVFEEKTSCEDAHENNFLKSGQKKNWSRSKTAQNYGRHCRQDAIAKNELSGPKKSANDNYFTSNLENRNKKNISMSSTFRQTSSNEKTWEENHDLMHVYGINHILEKNPLACDNEISAENVQKIGDRSCNEFYSLDPCELYWNNYLMSKAINNSLTERVIQWLDLTHKKRKKPSRHLETLIDKICANSVHKIFRGAPFEKESPEKTGSKNFRHEHKIIEKKEFAGKKEKFEEDVMSEVKCERSVSTFLSDEMLDAEKTQNLGKTVMNNSKNPADKCQSEKSNAEQEFKSNNNKQITMIAPKIDPEISKSVALEESILKTFVNVQELVFNTSSFENIQNDSCVESRDNKNSKKRQLYLPRQSKSLNAVEDEEWIMRKTTAKKFETKSKTEQANEEAEMWSEPFGFKIDKNFGDHSKYMKNDFQEKLERSIKASNQTQNGFRQFSPKEQLQQDILWLKGSKNAWQMVKDIKRPQLHIFMPLIFSKEPSEDYEYDRCVTELS